MNDEQLRGRLRTMFEPGNILLYDATRADWPGATQYIILTLEDYGAMFLWHIDEQVVCGTARSHFASVGVHIRGSYKISKQVATWANNLQVIA